LAVAVLRPLPTPHQHGDFLVATNQRCKMALSGAPSAAACPNEPEQRNGLRHAFEFMAATLLGDEQAGDLATTTGPGSASACAQQHMFAN
jgi:hypothetical protein